MGMSTVPAGITTRGRFLANRYIRCRRKAVLRDENRPCAPPASAIIGQQFQSQPH